jgi:hypothetical protein
VTTGQILLGTGLILAFAVGSQVLASRLYQLTRRYGPRHLPLMMRRHHLWRVSPRPPGRIHYGFVTEHYDAIIVGSGGGTLAHRPGPSGKRILRPERGDFLVSEMDSWNSATLPVRRGFSDFGARHELQGPRAGQPLRPGYQLLPSISAANPALTVMANAIRVGEHLIRRMS